MTRRTITEMKAEILSLLPDNTIGAISPQDVRDVVNNMLDSVVPTAAIIYGPLAPVGITLTATPTKLVGIFNSGGGTGDVNELQASNANSNIVVSAPAGIPEKCLLRVNFDITVQGQPNDDLVFTLARNGVLTDFRAIATGRGVGNFVTVSGEWLYVGATTGDIIELYGFCATGANCTVSSAAIIASLSSQKV